MRIGEEYKFKDGNGSATAMEWHDRQKDIVFCQLHRKGHRLDGIYMMFYANGKYVDGGVWPLPDLIVPVSEEDAFTEDELIEEDAFTGDEL